MTYKPSKLRLPQFISIMYEQSRNYLFKERVMKPLLRVDSVGKIYIKDKKGHKRFLNERDRNSFLESTLKKFDYHYDID